MRAPKRNGADPMDDTGTYGQFGQAVYDYDERLWQLSRSPNTSHTLRSLGEPKIVIEGCSLAHATGFPQHAKEGPTRRRENQTKALIKVHPELQPAFGLLPDLTRVSEAVEEASDRHDPNKGNLLAFGIITDELAKRRVGVAAFPTGPTGSDLRIIQVQKQRRGWHDIESAYLQVPTIYGESATWKGPGVAIQSIVFATPLEGSESLLAVRLITETLIFRPVLRKARLPGGSRMDMNLLHSLGLDQTQNSPPADVEFNLWYPRQFALLNQAGAWTLYELEGQRAERMKQLCPTRANQTHENATQPISNHAWGRIVWLSSPSTVAVCSRTKVTLFDIAQQDPIELQELDVGLDKFGQILDMVFVPSHPNHVIIITSVHLILYHVETVRNEDVANKVAYIRHFRNPNDISLRASCFSEEENTFVFVRSDLDPTVLVYRLNLNDSGGIPVTDPTALELSSVAGLTGSAGVSAIHLGMVEIKGSLNDALQRALFFNMTTLHKDLSVKQTLHVTSANEDSLPELATPTWKRDLTKSVRNVSDDDFIVDDEHLDETQTETLSVEPFSNFAMRLREQAQADPRDWTVQYDHAVRCLNNVDVTDVTDVDEILEIVQETLRTSEVDKTLPFGIVRELAEGEMTCQDIESVSARLEKLLSDHAGSLTGVTYKIEAEHEGQGPQLTLRSMMLPSTLQIPGNDPSDRLRATVEHILETWTPPAIVNLSEIVRHSRAQLARRMAIEVCLASLIIRLEDSATEQLPLSQSQTGTQSQAWELPVRPGAPPSSRTTPSLYLEASSQESSSRLPTPSDSASTSAVTSPNPALARLSRYTTFTSAPSAPPLPRRLNRVLAHWTLSADPTTYDWASASRHFSRRDAEEGEGEELTAKERARLQRRTERYVRRQRREAEETQRMQVLSSQVPEIARGGDLRNLQDLPQPGRLARAGSQLGSEGQSQSQGQAVASQVLPGRYGGRPAKKKRRKSGF